MSFVRLRCCVECIVDVHDAVDTDTRMWGDQSVQDGGLRVLTSCQDMQHWPP